MKMKTKVTLHAPIISRFLSSNSFPSPSFLTFPEWSGKLWVWVAKLYLWSGCRKVGSPNDGGFMSWKKGIKQNCLSQKKLSFWWKMSSSLFTSWGKRTTFSGLKTTGFIVTETGHLVKYGFSPAQMAFHEMKVQKPPTYPSFPCGHFNGHWSVERTGYDVTVYDTIF